MLSSDTYKLENAFHILNQNLFSGALPTVMITIQSSRSSYGHCTTQKVWASGGEMMYELNLGAEYLDRPIENVMATLVHEMVHIYCMECGIKDTSNGGRYHNKNFKLEAEKRGLIISKADVIGWSVTQPSEKFIENIHRWGLDQACENCRVGADFMGHGGNSSDGSDGTAPLPTAGKRKKPSSTRKYKCPVCGCSVRATKYVNIMCMDCGEQMVLADE